MGKKPEELPKAYQIEVDISDIKRGLREANAATDAPWMMERVLFSMPEDTINMSTSSSWEQVFKEGGEAASKAARAAGISERSLKILEFARQAWTGSEPMPVSLPLNFVTEEDPVEDVMKPALSMLALNLPVKTKGKGFADALLIPPVNRAGDNPQRVPVRLGTMGVFPSVLPTNVDIDFSTTMCTSPSNPNKAYPLKAEGSFEFIASELPIRNDIGFQPSFSGSGSTSGFSISQPLFRNSIGDFLGG